MMLAMSVLGGGRHGNFFKQDEFRGVLAFSDPVKRIESEAGDDLAGIAARPVNLNGVDGGSLRKANFEAEWIAPETAAGSDDAVDRAGGGTFAEVDFDTGTDGGAVGLSADQLELEPAVVVTGI